MKPPFRTLCVAAAFAMSQTMTASAQDETLNVHPVAAEFINSCSACHGEDGKGAGFLTRLFKGVNPGDLTQLSANNGGVFPTDKVFEVIDGRTIVAAHGERKMPVWGDRYWGRAMSQFGPDELNQMRARSRVLELVFYLQSIQE